MIWDAHRSRAATIDFRETAPRGATETIFGSSEFASLLQKEFRPKSDQARTAVEQAVKTLAMQALTDGRNGLACLQSRR